MKTIKLLNRVVLVIILGILLACGGSGGGGTELPAKTTIVSGVASKGIFKKGATVRIYGLKADGTEGELLKETSIVDDRGGYIADLGKKYTGAIIVKVFGSYRDEATNRDVLVSENNPLTAALPASAITTRPSGDIEANVMVTALTEIAVRKAKANGGLTEKTIADSNQAISRLFGVNDILKTAPAVFDIATMQDKTTSDEQKKYSAVLATVSQYVLDTSRNVTPDASDLEKAISQITSGIVISNGTSSQLADAQIAYHMQQAAANMTTNSNTKSTISAAGSTVQMGINDLSIIGSASGSKMVELKLKTVSSGYAGKFSGLQVYITLPSNVTIHAGNSGAVTPVANALVESSLKYGVLSLGLGFSTEMSLGEFATLYCDVPANMKISAAGFNPVTVVKVVDSKGAPLSGIGVEVF